MTRLIRPIHGAIRRVRTIVIDPQMFVELCKDQARLHLFVVAKNPLPADARVVGAEYDALADRWHLAVESEEFDVLEENQAPPKHPMTVFHRVTVERSDEYLLNGWMNAKESN